jgi:uncharacterized protein YraI
MKNFMPLAVLALALTVLPAAVQAQPQQATTSKRVNLRAGPARDFPLVAVLPAGLAVSVQGCLPDYRWCDVIAGYQRGWVYAGNLNYFYQGHYGPLPNYAPLIGLVVFGFILDDYWGHHYVDRPWYRDRHRWVGRFYPAPAPAPRLHARPAPPPHFVPAPPHRPGPAPAPRIRGDHRDNRDHGNRGERHHDKR